MTLRSRVPLEAVYLKKRNLRTDEARKIKPLPTNSRVPRLANIVSLCLRFNILKWTWAILQKAEKKGKSLVICGIHSAKNEMKIFNENKKRVEITASDGSE